MHKFDKEAESSQKPLPEVWTELSQLTKLWNFPLLHRSPRKKILTTGIENIMT